MKAVVLLSGGMDSTVNLYEAVKQEEVVLALTFDYGQKAASKEIEAAKNISAQLQVPHQVLHLPFFKQFGHSSLIDSNMKLPLNQEVSIDDLPTSLKSAKSVWVPNRNGIFLNIAAGFAEALNADTLIPGFNKEEAMTFPDNSFEFMNQVSKTLSYSTANSVQVKCYTVQLNKSEIVKRGQQLGVNWQQIWPCYQALNRWCGQCESCLRAQRAFKANGLEFL